MRTSLSLLFSMLISFCASSQFSLQSPLAGHEGIHKSDTRIKFWANSCLVDRGWKDIADTSLGKATMGMDSFAIGEASVSVVSLGDGGSAVLSFENPIKNGEGPDFAVFENGFVDPENDTVAFLELAFVEVSSDGAHFVRFPAISAIQTDTQILNSSFSDARFYHNLAGKHILDYGTPFDLEDLKDSSGIDIDHITHVRIIDVVGSLDPEYASYDHLGNLINDPYITPFPSGGFDLNGIAVLNAATTSISEPTIFKVQVFPNPTQDLIYLKSNQQQMIHVSIYNWSGQSIYSHSFQKETTISLAQFPIGTYILKWNSNHENGIIKIQKY